MLQKSPYQGVSIGSYMHKEHIWVGDTQTTGCGGEVWNKMPSCLEDLEEKVTKPKHPRGLTWRGKIDMFDRRCICFSIVILVFGRGLLCLNWVPCFFEPRTTTEPSIWSSHKKTLPNSERWNWNWSQSTWSFHRFRYVLQLDSSTKSSNDNFIGNQYNVSVPLKHADEKAINPAHCR